MKERARTLDAAIGQLVLEHDETRRLWAINEALNVVFGTRRGSCQLGGRAANESRYFRRTLDLVDVGADAQRPVLAVLVPDDGVQAKDLPGDGADAVVDVAVGRAL
jgi:hypothetical protein